ncbi:MAG: ABC transporter substrate-binding protein [Candidatus Izemoplasmatales bacterium]|nr:ABC transporter substrate-binding protein [Candidatus Izemoplasmatales bacterium]
MLGRIMRKALILFLFLGIISIVFSCSPQQTGEKPDTFRMLSNWETVGLKNHINGGASTGILNFFAVEPLIQYVRSTDEIYYMLAESVDHQDNGTSIIHLREGAKWHNGDDYLAEDVVAYYYINQLEATNYMSAIESVDSKTVKITWKSHMEPNDSVKNLILAVDPVGSVKYSEFKTYVDRVMATMAAAPDMPDGYTGWAPFGKTVTDQQETDNYSNYAEFTNYNPTWFVGTGPYKPYNINATDMILIANEDHWAYEFLEYKYVRAYNNITDPTQIYGMLMSGQLDYAGGIPVTNTLDQILSGNQDLVHYKCNDPGANGIIFNLAKQVSVGGEMRPLFNEKIREAFHYIFDRESIAYVANPYSNVTYRSMMAMAPSDAKRYMSDAAWDSLTLYRHDESKAAELLEDGGWTKQGSNWYGEDGKKISFTLHFDGSNDHQARAAQATAAQLNSFGIDTKLKSSSSWNDWFGSAQSYVWSSELSLNWTDLNMSFSYPTGSFVYAFRDVTHKVIHLPKYPAMGEPGWEEIDEKDLGEMRVFLPKFDESGTFRLIDRIQGLYALSDQELQEAVDDIITGVASQNWAVPFYQNTCGMFYNKATVTNLPRQDMWATSRNIDYVPSIEDEDLTDFYDFGRLNVAFSYAVNFIDWDRLGE